MTDPKAPADPSSSGEFSTDKTVHSFPHPFGRYTLQARLGVGGMAEVFRATQTGPGQFSRDLVLKRLLPHHADNPRFIQMFRQEAEVVGRLNHTNIVQVFELGEQDGQYFIAMEFINGLSLYQLARRAWDAGRGLPLELCLAAVSDAARGLSYASRLPGPDGRPLGVVHRDATPENLMMNREGITKVLDFGVARLADGERTTQHGEVKGKVPYLAPEQISGDPLDHRTDLYALGVTLYWLLTGRRPFRAESDLWLMEAILDEPPLPPSKLNPEIPKSVEDWVLCLLAKDPNDRPADGATLADALILDSRVPRSKIGETVAQLMDTPPAPLKDDDDHEFVAAEPMTDEMLASIKAVPPEVLERARRSRARRPRGNVGVPRAALVGLAGVVAILSLVVVVLLLRPVLTSDDRGGSTSTGPVVADAGTAQAVTPPTDSGAFEFAGEGEGEPSGEGEGETSGEGEGESAVAKSRAMRVTAPSHIRWTTSRGRTLGRGTTTLSLPTGVSVVFAADKSMGMRSRVPVRARFNYATLGKGQLTVLVYPYADVFAGTKKLGSTPLKTLSLTEGTYKLRFVAGEKTVTKTVTVRANRTQKLRVNMNE